MKNQIFTEITPNRRQAASAFKATKLLLSQLVDNKKQIGSLFAGNWRSASRGTKLGIFWNYVLPLVPLGIYCLLAQIRVLPEFNGTNPVAFIALGVTLWFFLAGIIQVAIGTVDQKRKESAQTSFPLVCSIASGYAQLTFETVVRLTLTAIIFVLTDVEPYLEALLSTFILISAIPLFFSLGLLLSICNLIYKDVGRVITIVLQYGLFISGVIFPVTNIAILSELNAYNPFAIFIDATRLAVLVGEFQASPALLSFALLGVILLFVGCKVFYVMEERVVDN